ncbi:MAG: glycosyltransferase family 4 protein [Dehalococcoidia bacterium]
MRVLILTQFYPPDIGGVERHVHSLAHQLVGAGHQVAVATLAFPGCPAVEDEDGVRIYRLEGVFQRMRWLYSGARRFAAPVAEPVLGAALERVVEAERPEIVHAHNWLVYPFLPVAKKHRLPIVYTLHDYGFACAQMRLTRGDENCDGPGPVKCLSCAAGHYGAFKGIATVLGMRMSDRDLVRAVDRFIPVSTAVARGNRLQDRMVPFEVVPNFVPDEFPPPDAEALRLTAMLPEPGYLLFVGDLKRDKGILPLLDAYQQIPNRPPLVLIGRRTPDVPDALPEGAMLFESWPHAAVVEAFRHASVAFAPSIWEDPCPTVAMEAMLVGRPVIASRIGGLADIVEDGRSGLLVEPGNVAALRDSAIRLIDDPVFREALADGAAERARHFTASAVVPRIEAIYHEVLGRSGSGESLETVARRPLVTVTSGESRDQ